MSPLVSHQQNGTLKMLKLFSMGTRSIVTTVFISFAFSCSDATAQSANIEQEQQIAIWTMLDSDETYLCVPSGVEFCLANAIATALEQSGYENILLSVENPTSLPIKSMHNEKRQGDIMLIRITGESAQIYSGFKMSTLRSIVDALKSIGVGRFTLVDPSVIVDPDALKWRALHESSGSEQDQLREAERKFVTEFAKVEKQIDTTLLKLKPILEYCRVLTDGLARDPSVLK